ncbi:symmetrical bis(5'-nucleosyl)-tetraphosphatase [Uliginosibacterium sp. H1]|uniref:symmetrical bis(5'-nucleosyl)-tetraphosphatase n=1 Tax=Uliginosibacterium sp. H1 TaxID=3114757 RepID=UPI002E185C89|nr:symmetrical bis(5'-nucleosyl)-tetraphosphatase [Uliginosibacterium sp. H1]
MARIRYRYVVGDLQGCLDPLLRLLDEVDFDAEAGDRLWVVGDLINRGPQSVDTLRFVRGLDDAAVAVLGNHDLATLAAVAGVSGKLGKVPAAQELLDAPDAAELVDWLRERPLLHVDGSHVMVHAGLLPAWSVSQAQALAREVERALRSPDWREFMAQMFGNEPDRWSDDLQGWDRLRVVVNAMTRMRFLGEDGSLQMKAKGSPDQAPEGLLPWYAVKDAVWRSHTVLCGHWSALGLRDMGRVVALDSGCVWGGCLSALRLEDRRIFQVQCPEYAEIGSD